MIYLMLCPLSNRVNSERLKLLENPRAFKRLSHNQTKREKNHTTLGYRFVASQSYGKEFVHYFLTQQMEVLRTQTALAKEIYANFVTNRHVVGVRNLRSARITKLLQDMRDGSLRDLVLRDMRPLPAKKDNNRPASHKRHSSVAFSKVAREVDLGVGIDIERELPLKQQRKASERRAGRALAEADIQRVTQFSGMPRTRSANKNR